MSAAVVSVATSPAIDRISLVPDGPLEGVVRASRALETPGGKAIHAAMVARALGAEVRLVAPVGGRRGELLRDLLVAEGLESSMVPVAAETRSTHTLVVAELGDRVEIHDPRGGLSPAECGELVATARADASAARVVVVAGGLPPEAPADLHRRLLDAGREQGAFTILDTSSVEAFELGLGAAPDLVKLNLAELSAVLGGVIQHNAPPGALAALAERLRGKGAGAVWLSLGERGSILATSAGSRLLAAPVERVVNAVGCGDALAGGVAAGIARGLELVDAAVLGVAAAADKLGRLHSGRVERASAERLVARVRQSPVPDEALANR
jgi:1-phosphofructokinase family hexose kinase